MIGGGGDVFFLVVGCLLDICVYYEYYFWTLTHSKDFFDGLYTFVCAEDFYYL